MHIWRTSTELQLLHNFLGIDDFHLFKLIIGMGVTAFPIIAGSTAVEFISGASERVGGEELSLILGNRCNYRRPGCLSLVEGRPRDRKSWSEAGEPMPHAGRVGSNPTPGADIFSPLQAYSALIAPLPGYFPL